MCLISVARPDPGGNCGLYPHVSHSGTTTDVGIWCHRGKGGCERLREIMTVTGQTVGGCGAAYAGGTEAASETAIMAVFGSAGALEDPTPFEHVLRLGRSEAAEAARRRASETATRRTCTSFAWGSSGSGDRRCEF